MQVSVRLRERRERKERAPPVRCIITKSVATHVCRNSSLDVLLRNKHLHRVRCDLTPLHLHIFTLWSHCVHTVVTSFLLPLFCLFFDCRAGASRTPPSRGPPTRPPSPSPATPPKSSSPPPTASSPATAWRRARWSARPRRRGRWRAWRYVELKLFTHRGRTVFL